MDEQCALLYGTKMLTVSGSKNMKKPKNQQSLQLVHARSNTMEVNLALYTNHISCKLYLLTHIYTNTCLQLSATNATEYYFNPDTPEYHEIRSV